MKIFSSRKNVYGFLTTVVGSALLLGTCFVPNLSEARNGAGRVNRRQSAESHRIREGRKEGDFSKREIHDLRGDRRQIRRIEHRALKNDGKIGPKEGALLETKQDQLSGKIYEYRHNDEARGNPKPGSPGGAPDNVSVPSEPTTPAQE